MVQLTDLRIPDLHRFRFHYTQQELTYAATPYLLSYLLSLGYAGAAFFKQDSLGVGNLAPILDTLNRHAIVLTPHLLEPLRGRDGIERELNLMLRNVGPAAELSRRYHTAPGGGLPPV